MKNNGVHQTIQYGNREYKKKIGDWIDRMKESNAGAASSVAMRNAREAWAREGM